MGLNVELFEVGPSTGTVAGLISGGLSIAHQAIPLTFALILIGMLYRREYNAASWSAIARHIQKSGLPTIIAADGGISWILSPGVFVVCLLSITVAILVPIASFMTPIPLTNNLVAAKWTKTVDFQYVPDLSFYGQATLVNPSTPIKRVCDQYGLFGDCPNSIYDDAAVRSQYPGHVVVNSTIPDITVAPYRSSSMPATVAGPLQIQYRNWYEGNNSFIDNDQPRLVGGPRAIESYILQDGFYLVEGLIIDATNGGVGFRNHTIPTALNLGAEWDEDILWVEPVTACSSTNLSLHFSISTDYVTASADGYLRDDGGFFVLSEDPPSPRWDDDEDLTNNWRAIGYPPDLQNRADVLAFWNNRFTAQQLNITSSQVGERYIDQLFNYGNLASPSSLVIRGMDGTFLDNNYYQSPTSNTDMFEAYGWRCTGYDDINPSTVSKAFVRCGYLFSVPTPLYNDVAYNQPTRYDLGSNWTQQLYTCASSTKASIKTVTFRFNGTNSLNSLTVLDVQPKDYNNTALPRWAIENSWGYEISGVNPFWGLTSAQATSDANTAVYETDEIYLPASTRYNDFSKIFDNFAAGEVFGFAWNSVYSFSAAVKGISLNFIPSYSGDNSYGLTLKWRRLSQTQDGAANILNLIWTDLVAFAVVGTVTGFETQTDSQPFQFSSASPILGSRTVHPLVHQVGYSNIYYAIPAFILGGILLVGALGSLVFACMGRLSLRRLEYYINQTSLGRALMQHQRPDAAPVEAPSSEWKKKAGKLIVNVPRLGPRKRQAKKSLLNPAGSLRTQASTQSFAMSNFSGVSGGNYEPIHAREHEAF